MKRVLAIFAILALAATADEATRAKYRHAAEEHAAKGDWHAVGTDVFDMAASDRAYTDAGATMYELTVKYLPVTDERRANNFDAAAALLKIAIQNDKYDVRALTLLSTIYKEKSEHARPEMKETYAGLSKIMHENAVDASERVQRKPGERWTVGFIQDETVTHPIDPDDALVLRRAPFTIRVLTMTPRTAVQINAAASDINIRRVRAGYRLVEDCETKERIPFCLGSEFAEGNRNEAKRLNVDPEGAHWVYYESYADHRWSKITREGSFLYILDRDIANLSGTPIEQTTMPRLYITVLHRTYDKGVLTEDEIRRIPIRFR